MSWLNSLKVRLGLYLAWSCALTWPLAKHLFTAFPLGLERSRSVPQLNMWTIWWNADRVLHGCVGYWHAPIFHPHEAAFALSEPQPITMLLAPLVWLFPASAAPYNIYLLGSLVLNALLADLLLRHLKLSPLVSFYGGLMVAALPFVHWQRDVIQLIPIWGALWFWLSLSRFAERMTVRRGLIVGLALSSVVLSCLHHALFLVMLSLVACWWLVSDRLLDRRFWLGMLAAAGLAALICGPFLFPQIKVLRDGEWGRDPATVEALSALPIDYLWVWFPLWHSQPTLPYSPDRVPWAMSPGWMVLALASVAIVLQVTRWYRNRREPPFAELIEEGAVPPGEASASQPASPVLSSIPSVRDNATPRSVGRWVGMFVTIAIVSLTLSCGAHLKFGDVDIHQFLVKYVPGYQQLRSPFRCGLFFQLVTIMLAAVTVEALREWGLGAFRSGLAGKARPTERQLWLQVGWVWAMTAVMGLSLCEHRWHMVPLHEIPSVADKSRLQPEWVDWLIEHTEEADVIAHLPFPQGNLVYDYETTTDAMFWQMRHGRTMVNGYSGFFPLTFVLAQTASYSFPSPDSLTAFKNIDVRWCIITRSFYEPNAPQPFTADGLRHVFFDEPSGVDIYLLE